MSADDFYAQWPNMFGSLVDCLAESKLVRDLTDRAACRAYLRHMGWDVNALTPPILTDICQRALHERTAA